MISLHDVWSAKAAVEGYVHRTPALHSSNLSAAFGSEVYFKCENQQKTGSFKARGAFNCILSLTEEQKKRGVVCYSSGNHAQAVSYAAALLGIEAWVFMPETAAKAKVDACRGYGGNVALYGQTGADAYPKALEFAKEKGMAYIDPVEDDKIMAGQGTAGIEIMEDVPDADIIFVPVGGGGLISGISTAVKGLSPKTKIVGVEPENMNCMNASIDAGKIVKITRRPSIADGLAGDAPGSKAFATVSERVDTLITVSDEEIEAAALLIMQRTKQFIEPSAAAAFAGFISRPDLRGNKNVFVLSGGNANLKVLGDIFLKER